MSAVPEGGISVLVVDDHPVVRSGLQAILELQPEWRIVGAVGTAAEAVASVEQLRPDVVLLDMRLPDGEGGDVCRRIKASVPGTRVLFLTSYASNELVLAAMDAGGDGYLLKDTDLGRIADAIRMVLRGGTVFDPVVTRRVLEGARNGRGLDPLRHLTPQELRVLAEVARGSTDKEVAVALGLSSKTVRNYLDRVFEKLNVRTRTQAAMIYAERSKRQEEREREPG